jgi:hypothetical protein
MTVLPKFQSLGSTNDKYELVSCTYFFQASYLDTYSQPMTVEHLASLKVLSPFEIAQTVLDLQKVPLNYISVDEKFILEFTFRNISTSPMRINACSLNITVSVLTNTKRTGIEK